MAWQLTDALVAGAATVLDDVAGAATVLDVVGAFVEAFVVDEVGAAAGAEVDGAGDDVAALVELFGAELDTSAPFLHDHTAGL